MSNECYDPILQPAPIGEDRWLARNGSNRMVAVLYFIPGSARRPGLAVDGDEDTGFFRPNADELGVTLGKFERFRWAINGVQIVNNNGRRVTLQHNATANRVLTLPDRTATLATEEISEEPAGAKNGSNVAFTISLAPAGASTAANAVRLSINGLLQKPEVDYTRSGLTLTLLTFVPLADDDLWAVYTPG